MRRTAHLCRSGLGVGSSVALLDCHLLKAAHQVSDVAEGTMESVWKGERL